MNFHTFRMAGINFGVESDVEIVPINHNFSTVFATNNPDPDVIIRITGIERSTLVLPLVTAGDLLSLSDIISPKYLYQDTLALLPVIADDVSSHLRSPDIFSDDKLNIRLLQSPFIRSKIEFYLNQPDQKSLWMNYFCVVFQDFDTTTIEMYYLSALKMIFQESWFQTIDFRSMFARSLTNFSGTMVHSSAVVRNDRTAIFVASDGGGKTGVVEKVDSGSILSDDQNFLKKEGNSFYVYGSPWGKYTKSNHSTRLGAIFLLEKAPIFELAPLNPIDLFNFLWNEHWTTWILLPKEIKLKLFNLLYDICRQTPAYRMRFPKDDIDWLAIDSVLRGT